MEDKFKRLQELFAEIDDLNRAADVLRWDHMTNMPSGGTRARGHQIGTISRVAHEKLTSPEVGRLLENLSGANGFARDSWQAGLIRKAKREFEKATKIPSAMVEEESNLRAQSHLSWEKAKHEADFMIFSDDLKRSVEWQQRYARLFEPYEHVYDPFLDNYEPGLKTSEIRSLFAGLRKKQVALVKKIGKKPQVDNSFLHQAFDEDKQWETGKMAVTSLGYDWEKGRMDKVAHPFSVTLGFGDVRITNKVDPGFFNTLFFANLHETGHALYEQGLPEAYSRTPLFQGASMSVHESQSRLWENHIGRSRPFWEFQLPILQVTFPGQFGDVDLDTFYKGINRVEPSPIRGQADEATYNLHIMIRTELEIAMLEGSVNVDDLPDTWNRLMDEYLGVIPENDAEGVLQDAHWAHGSFGYFPTYALGNLIAAQIWRQLQSDLQDIDSHLRQGNFSEILSWLRSKIHIHGAVFEPQDLIERVTGSRLNEDDYLSYLNKKYGEIYNL